MWPRAQRTAERRQHTCLALLPRQRIGSEVVAICLCSDKMKYKYGRGIYRYEMWLSLALKIMALSTQLHWSTFHTHKICTSEQNWPSSWTCLCLRALASAWVKKQLWQLALSDVVVRWMHVWGRSLLANSRCKENWRENLHSEPPLPHKTWLSDIHRPLQANLKDRRTTATK